MSEVVRSSRVELEVPSPDGVMVCRWVYVEGRPVLTPPDGYRLVVAYGNRSMFFRLEREVG